MTTATSNTKTAIPARPITAFAALAALAAIAMVPTAGAYYPEYGTSSTGNVDTWNLPDEDDLYLPDCHAQLKPIGGQCDFPLCPQYFANRVVVLRLLDPSPGDKVSLEAFGGQAPLGPPVDVATYDDPEAHVAIRVAGCSPGITAIVTGLLVEGEVAYELDIASGGGLEQICFSCTVDDLFPVQLP